MTEKELADIAERSQDRRKLKRKASPGSWCYDSLGYLLQVNYPCEHRRVKPGKRIAVLVRPVTWFRALQEQHGREVDEGIPQSGYLPVYRSAQYIVAALNETVEEDIDSLLKEVRRLRKLLPCPTGEGGVRVLTDAPTIS